MAPFIPLLEFLLNPLPYMSPIQAAKSSRPVSSTLVYEISSLSNIRSVSIQSSDGVLGVVLMCMGPMALNDPWVR